MVCRVKVPEGAPITLLGQFYTEDQTLVQASEVSKIVLRGFERPADAPASETFSKSITVGDGSTGAILNTAATDARWRGDAVGYNFRYVANAPEMLAHGGATTRLEVTITLAAGGVIREAWELDAEPFLGSL